MRAEALDNEVSVVPFSFKYLPMLLEMHKSHHYLGISYITMKTLPKIGYIALMNNQPIAAGFLRRVEGGYAQIDTLVSNPYFGGMIRHDCINKVFQSLLSEAKDLKLNGIIGFTKDEGVLKRAREAGFTESKEQIVISLSTK